MVKRLKIYSINLGYIYYLKKFDDKVCDPKEDHHERPYIGTILFETSNFYYFAPLTSQKDKPEFFCVKLYDQKGEIIAGVLINNMIPIPKNSISLYQMINTNTYTSSSDMDDWKYGELLKNELLSMNEKKQNRLIHQKAKIFYRDYKYNERIKNCCVDFELLEQKSLLYKDDNRK